MILVAITSLLLGVVCGHFLFSAELVAWIDQIMPYALWMLIFFIGIEIGTNKTVFRKIREYNVRILVVPVAVALGSISAGMLAGLFMGQPLHEAGAVASGMGFYSVSAVILREMGSAQLGTVAFLTNLIRETLAILLIPLVAKYFGKYAAIAPSGATAMDTTLPVIAKATDQETALIAVITGVVLTGLVPVLVPLIYNFSI